MTTLHCHDVECWIARAANGGLDRAEQQALDAHLARCESCRTALEDQRRVAHLLHARAESPAPAGFASRVAARIGQEADSAGFLPLVNWRAWTVGLAPVACGLCLAAYLGVGTSTTGADVTDTTTTYSAYEALLGTSSLSAPALLQSTATGDVLLESVLTGAAPSGDTDDR